MKQYSANVAMTEVTAGVVDITKNNYSDFGKSFRQHFPDGFAVSQAQLDSFVC